MERSLTVTSPGTVCIHLHTMIIGCQEPNNTSLCRTEIHSTNKVDPGVIQAMFPDRLCIQHRTRDTQYISFHGPYKFVYLYNDDKIAKISIWVNFDLVNIKSTSLILIANLCSWQKEYYMSNKGMLICFILIWRIARFFYLSLFFSHDLRWNYSFYLTLIVSLSQWKLYKRGIQNKFPFIHLNMWEFR